MSARIVIADAGPLIAFASIGRLELLPQLFGTVIIPPEVRDEIAPTIAQLPGWLAVDDHSVTDILPDLPRVLDPGERHAIALALSTGINRVLIDDLTGRKVAHRLGLNVIGTFGAVALARNEGLIPEARPLLDALVRGGLFATLPLYRQVIENVGEDFPEDPPFPLA